MTVIELLKELQDRLEDYPELADQTINGLDDIIIQDRNGCDFYVSLEAAE